MSRDGKEGRGSAAGPRSVEAAGETGEPTPPADFVMERFGRIDEMDRAFDFAYWQRQGDAAIFRAAWELVELHHRDQGGRPEELRVQRTVEVFQRRREPPNSS